MTTPSAILTDEHFQNLKNAVDQAAQIQREIDLAKQAGLDVTMAQATLTDFLNRAQRIRQTYFPGR